jgi:Flp pilus assembly protein TadG
MATPVRNRRRNQRGAAMVEAAFMLPMFVILFFTTLYLHNLNSKQIALNNTARESAWSYARANCGIVLDADSEVYDSVDSGGDAASTIATTNGSNEAGSAASTAFSAGSVTGGMAAFVSTVTTAISSVFPNPTGSQKKSNDTVAWNMVNLYANGSSGSQTTQTPTPVAQTVTVYCDEAPQDGSLGKVISDFMGFVKSLI